MALFIQSGGGSGSYQLMLSEYYYGQLVKYYDGWSWCPNNSNMFIERYLKEFFINKIECAKSIQNAWRIVTSTTGLFFNCSPFI